MSLIKNYILEIKYLLSDEHKKEFNFFFFLFFLAMVFEMLGVGMILPVLNLMVNQELFFSSSFFSNINFFNNFSQKEIIFFLIGFIFSIYVTKSLFLVFVYKKEVNFLKNIRVSLSKKLFSTYIKLPYEFHINSNSGNLIRNITDIKIFISLIIHTLSLIVETLILLGLTFFLMLYEPIGTLSALLILSIIGLVFNFTIRKKSSYWGAQRQKYEGLKIINTQQGLNSIKDIKILSKENYFIDTFNQSEEKAASSVQNHDFIIRLPKVILEITAIFILLSLLLLLINSNADFKNFIPTLGLFTLASFRIFPSIARIMRSYQIIKFGMPVVNLLKSEISRDNENNSDFQKDNKYHKMEKNIEFKNVKFAFKNKSNFIFKNLNFSIKSGSSIGIYGTSGNGKTTFLNLLLGLIKPSQGDILIDGKHSIFENIELWQSEIGYVPQNIYLLEDNLKSNIAFGVEKSKINDDVIMELIKKVKLEKYFKTLKDGVDTIISEHGENLSGGQKQRIGIARCLYNNPKLIILDEATNALDKGTAKEIIQEINELKGDKTIIIISHDPETLKNCDEIYNLDEGNFVLTNKK